MRSWPIEETVLTAWLADTAAGGKGDGGVVDPTAAPGVSRRRPSTVAWSRAAPSALVVMAPMKFSATGPPGPGPSRACTPDATELAPATTASRDWDSSTRLEKSPFDPTRMARSEAPTEFDCAISTRASAPKDSLMVAR